MGFDYYMKVVGECNLRDFILACQNRCLENFGSTSNDDRIIAAKKWATEVNDRSNFFNNIGVEYDDFEISVSSWDDNLNLIVDQIHENENANYYVGWIFLEILLLAIDDSDPNLVQYCRVLDQIENISIKKTQTAQILIAYISSYKGRDNRDIDFLEIHENIEAIRNEFPSIQIRTILGQS